MHLNISKTTFNKPKTNIIPRSGAREGRPLLPLPFNAVLKVLVQAIRQKEKEKRKRKRKRKEPSLVFPSKYQKFLQSPAGTFVL